MIQAAKRLSNVSEYYFSRKLKQIAEMNAQGKDIINLGVGSPDMPPSQETIDELCKETKSTSVHGYQPYTGIPELRQGFVDFYQDKYGVSLDPSTEVQPLIGSKEGILHVSLAFVNPGDKVLVPNPGYPTYTSLSNLLGAEVVAYDLVEEDNWQPDFEALEQMDLSEVKIMWVNYPHMPTGANASKVLFERLVAFAKKHDVLVVNDNPYSLILNEEPMSILSVEGAKDYCIELNSMSKSHNMPGWRIGMLASNSTFIQWVLKVKSNIDSGMFRPMQMAAAKALHNSSEWHKEMNIDVYSRRRAYAGQILDALNCSYDDAQVGLFLWGKIPDAYKDVEALTEEVLIEASVFITPGFIFGSNGKRYVRISLCATEEKLQLSLDRIKANIK